MSHESGFHHFFNWTKERIDEMDAIISSFEAKTGQARSEMKTGADELAADLKKRRDSFRAKVKESLEAGENAAEAGRSHLESQWREFEARVDIFFDTFGKQVAQQQATFEQAAGAQAEAWRESAERLHKEAGKVGEKGRAEIESAVKKMKADAAEANARLQKLKQAGDNSWKAMSSALTESRKAFDRANQAAWNAIRDAASHRAA